MNIISEILKKDKLKIIVTDSGLGGLSVQALLDKELRKFNIASEFELIFFNSVALHDYGYNNMLEFDEKIKVFDSALSGMLKFGPDVILIACNTLSVLYYQTQTSKTIKIPVFGISDIGVELILEETKGEDDSNIILFGTETTINSNQHKNKLIRKGVKSERIISQPCKFLESEIQIDPESNSTKELIANFVDDSFRKINNSDAQTYAVFCCTHYGYSKEIFQKELNEKFGKNVFVLNPNEKMAELVASFFETSFNAKPQIVNKVYSRVDINKTEMEILGNLISLYSIGLFEALKEYKFVPDLFFFDDTIYQKSKK